MLSNDDLLSLFHKDEKKAFDILYSRYYESLYLFSNQLVNDIAAAKDIAQEIFISFWINRRFRENDIRLPHYLFQAVRYASLNYLRDQNRRDEINRDLGKKIDRQEREKTEQTPEEYEKLYRAISMLPDKRKEIFMLVFIDEMKYSEVASLLNISTNTIKTQLARAMKQLREIFNKIEP